LKKFSDPVEKCRSLAIEILKEFFTQCDDLTISFPYVFPILMNRLNADNLEGYEHIQDEKMKPAPSQKPMMVIDPTEPSEEVRLSIAEMVVVMVK
jgi:hypothetical protein